jgi:uncharacterized protein
MLEDSLVILAALFLVVGALYASVGHAGASGYLAVMALVGIGGTVMRPTALAINVVVASIAFLHFWRAGHFSWRLLLPFAVASIPAAFVGGAIQLPSEPLRIVIGIVLLLSALRMAWTVLRPAREPKSPVPPSLGVALLFGAALGFLSGLTGTGGGIFLSPLMIFFNWADMKRTAAVAAAFILVNSIAGLAGVIAQGWTPTPALGVLAVAAGIGGFAGAYYGSRRATPASLRILLASVLLVAGAKLLV